MCTQPDTLPYVPPLSYFCVRHLIPTPQYLHGLEGFTLHYASEKEVTKFNILRALIPNYKDSDDFELATIDPRLWATLIQLYSNLPPVFRTYILPLADKHIPLLNLIPSTTCFSLITVLELPDTDKITDASMSQVKEMRSLVALDISFTKVSSIGLMHLASAPTRSCSVPYLRMLRLKGCHKLGNHVYAQLNAFPLLSVVDLSETQCSIRGLPPGFGFTKSSDSKLFHPVSLLNSVTHLCETAPDLLPSSNTFILHVNSLAYAGAVPYERTAYHTQPVPQHGELVRHPNRPEYCVDSRAATDVFLQDMDHSISLMKAKAFYANDATMGSKKRDRPSHLNILGNSTHNSCPLKLSRSPPPWYSPASTESNPVSSGRSVIVGRATHSRQSQRLNHLRNAIQTAYASRHRAATGRERKRLAKVSTSQVERNELGPLKSRNPFRKPSRVNVV